MFNLDMEFAAKLRERTKEDELTGAQAMSLAAIHTWTQGEGVKFDISVIDPEEEVEFRVYAPKYYLVGTMTDDGYVSYACTSPDRKVTYHETDFCIYSAPHNMIERIVDGMREATPA